MSSSGMATAAGHLDRRAFRSGPYMQAGSVQDIANAGPAGTLVYFQGFIPYPRGLQ